MQQPVQQQHPAHQQYPGQQPYPAQQYPITPGQGTLGTWEIGVISRGTVPTPRSEEGPHLELAEGRKVLPGLLSSRQVPHSLAYGTVSQPHPYSQAPGAPYGGQFAGTPGGQRRDPIWNRPRAVPCWLARGSRFYQDSSPGAARSHTPRLMGW
jgi:hypothetical protein